MSRPRVTFSAPNERMSRIGHVVVFDTDAAKPWAADACYEVPKSPWIKSSVDWASTTAFAGTTS